MSFNTTISLSSDIRSNLLSLNTTSRLTNQTTTRLANGLKVASVVDNAAAYFQSQALSQRATDFTDRKAGIDQGVSALLAATNGTDAINALLSQLKGIVQAAQSQTTAQQKAASNQFYTIGRQISLLINDASYQGLNLLNTSTSSLNVSFSEKSNSAFVQKGYHLNTTVGTGTNLSLGLFTNAVGAGNAVFGAKGTVFNAQFIFGGRAANGTLSTFTAFGSYSAGILVNTGSSRFQATVTVIDNAINQLRGVAATLGGNVALLKTRLSFTSDYISTLQAGSDKLTLADLNEEGANLVSLQTRQALGIQSLSFAGQSQQGVLKLFG